MSVPGIHAEHWQTFGPEGVPEPDGGRPCLKPDLDGSRRPGADQLHEAGRVGRNSAFKSDRAVCIEHAHAGLFKRDIEGDILVHVALPGADVDQGRP